MSIGSSLVLVILGLHGSHGRGMMVRHGVARAVSVQMMMMTRCCCCSSMMKAWTGARKSHSSKLSCRSCRSCCWMSRMRVMTNEARHRKSSAKSKVVTRIVRRSSRRRCRRWMLQSCHGTQGQHAGGILGAGEDIETRHGRDLLFDLDPLLQPRRKELVRRNISLSKAAKTKRVNDSNDETHLLWLRGRTVRGGFLRSMGDIGDIAIRREESIVCIHKFVHFGEVSIVEDFFRLGGVSVCFGGVSGVLFGRFREFCCKVFLFLIFNISKF